MNSKIALMVCTHARGGMRSVVEAYERDGLMKKWRFEFLWTHREGGAAVRIAIALNAYFRLLSLLLRRRVSFMHVHAAMRGSFWRKSLFVSTARMFGVPSVLHLHGSETKTFYGALTGLRQCLARRTLEKAESVVVLSESWRDYISHVAPGARITVINNYVKVPDELPDTSLGQGFSVLFLGVLGQRKGIYDLLDCWSSVLRSIPNARLLIGGNGDLVGAQAWAEKLSLGESVQFLGWVDGPRKLELLKSADAFVLPSYNEGLPMSVLEAMSWGTAVVTTRVGGIPEVITSGRDGLLIDAGDQAGLAAALIQLGTELDFRKSIGLAGRERIESAFSDIAVLPKLEGVYRDVLLRKGCLGTM